MKKIYSIPLTSNFIHEFGDFFHKDGLLDYSKTAVVFSGRRPFLYLQKFLAGKIKKPFYPPRMFTINEFVNYISEKSFPDISEIKTLDAVWILYKLWEGKKHKNFAEFYTWGKRIFDFINKIDSENIDNDKLKGVEENAEIGFDIPDSINSILKHIVTLRKEFHKELEKRNEATRGYAYLKACRIIESEKFEDFEKIYFGGLFGLTGAEKKIIKILLDNNKAEVVWQGHHKDWKILNDLVSYFNYEVFSLKEKAESECNIKIYSAVDSHAEVLKAYNILKENSIDTCVVLPESGTLFPLLSFAIDRLKEKKFNISLQYPLDRTSLFSLLSDLINCQLSCRMFGDQRRYYSKDYLGIFSNPFIKNIENLREFIPEINKIIDERPFIPLNEMKSDIGGVEKAHRILFKELEDISNVFEACEKLEQILDFILEKSEIKSYILSGEIFNQFFNTLTELKSVSVANQPISDSPEENRNSVWNIILDYMSDQSLPFETKPLQDLEIIGMLETRNLNFSNVIMLDVEENILPSEKKIDPIIPIGLYEKLGLPSVKDNEEIYKYYFYRLINASKTAHLLYRYGVEREKSRYIEQIIWQKELKAQKAGVMKIESSTYGFNFITSKENHRIEKDGAIMDKLKKTDYSATAIDSFLQCQLRFYYEKILGLEIPEEITPDIDQRERGNIVHNVLKDIFVDYKGKIVNPDDYDDLNRKLELSLKQHLGKYRYSGEYYVFGKIAEYKMKGFLKSYIKDSNKKFKVLRLEDKKSMVYKLDSVEINLKGTIDRIDYIPDADKYEIIDYKTAKKKTTYKYNYDFDLEFGDIEIIRDRIKSFQLPIYTLLLSEHEKIDMEKINAKLLFLGDMEEICLFNAKSENFHKKIINDYYLKALDTILSEIMDPAKPFTKYEEQNCSSCLFANLCRQNN